MAVISNWFKYIILKNLLLKKKIKNVCQLPFLRTIILTMNTKNVIQNLRNLSLCFGILEIITNQTPKICFAKKSIANFKIQKNMPLNCLVSLRKRNKQEFLYFFIFFILPNIKLNVYKNMNSISFGVKSLLFIPQLKIINKNFLNSFGFNVTFNFNKKDLALFLSSLQIKN